VQVTHPVYMMRSVLVYVGIDVNIYVVFVLHVHGIVTHGMDEEEHVVPVHVHYVLTYLLHPHN